MSTQPTDDEIDALWDGKDLTIPQLVQRRIITRAALAKWGAPVVAKWAPEEIADGERGIRWVTNEGIHGRPTDHDVREYLKRTPTAHGCHCDECKQFYTAPQPVREPLSEAQVQELIEAKHFRKGYDLKASDQVCLGWYRLGLRDGERAHGITGGQHD